MADAAPRRLSDVVWLVGSGTDEVVLTDPHDCHAYLVWDGTGGLLVDAGTGLGADRWLRSAAAVCDLDRLTGVLVTHYHADHAGGAAAASGAGLALLAGRETDQALAGPDEERTSLARARSAGVYPADYRLAPATVDRVVGHGDELYAGDGVRLSVVATPGHCDGHLGVQLDGPDGRWLFSGDCLFAGGRVGMQAIPDCRLDVYADTVIHLAGLGVDALLPGHGEQVLQGAGADITAAARSFARLVPPPNWL